jgi:hypothetical protein
LPKAVSVFEAGIGDALTYPLPTPWLPRMPPREATHDEHAREALYRSEEEDEGGWPLPE